VTLLFVGTLVAVGARQAPPPADQHEHEHDQPASRPGGWTVPPGADQEKNPLSGDASAIATGKQLYEKTCKKCHGPGGKGDGPDADPDHQEDMDLTVARRAARNPDGVVFYKVFNGRQKPKMPAQKNDLTKDQIWAIVSYVQTLRQRP
jgi:mono/diheme cytochrome c family protein